MARYSVEAVSGQGGHVQLWGVSEAGFVAARDGNWQLCFDYKGQKQDRAYLANFFSNLPRRARLTQLCPLLESPHSINFINDGCQACENLSGLMGVAKNGFEAEKNRIINLNPAQ